jgi:hypothetical protein
LAEQPHLELTRLVVAAPEKPLELGAGSQATRMRPDGVVLEKLEPAVSAARVAALGKLDGTVIARYKDSADECSLIRTFIRIASYSLRLPATCRDGCEVRA